jgi:predicted AlkP superfamily pyrophosphatase or phosphodiesterase
MPPVVLINAVGLTSRLLEFTPKLRAAAAWGVPLQEALPAVTCTAQATILTGKPASGHGIVANGWHFRDTTEVRFWQQSNRLIQAEPLYETLAREAAEQGRAFTSAKLFWWFNQGAAVDTSVTPKPWYGLDGDKVFDISTTPPARAETLKAKLGLTADRPDLSLVYLPHLDYEPQRRGPSRCDMAQFARELDDAAAPLLDAAKALGSQVWVVSEYGHCDVSRPVELNRVLNAAGLLQVRTGPFGDQLDLYESRAFAVVDHQLAHVSVRNAKDIARVRGLLEGVPGVATVLEGEARGELDHPRSGELVVLSTPDAWFGYRFWADDADAPDYARSVAIHHKPGYDPCELFFDPKLRAPKLRLATRLAKKKLGFRTKFDVVPLDPAIVRGSHGLRAADPLDKPVLLGHGPKPTPAVLPMTAVRDVLYAACQPD